MKIINLNFYNEDGAENFRNLLTLTPDEMVLNTRGNEKCFITIFPEPSAELRQKIFTTDFTVLPNGYMSSAAFQEQTSKTSFSSIFHKTKIKYAYRSHEDTIEYQLNFTDGTEETLRINYKNVFKKLSENNVLDNMNEAQRLGFLRENADDFEERSSCNIL